MALPVLRARRALPPADQQYEADDRRRDPDLENRVPIERSEHGREYTRDARSAGLTIRQLTHGTAAPGRERFARRSRGGWLHRPRHVASRGSPQGATRSDRRRTRMGLRREPDPNPSALLASGRRHRVLPTHSPAPVGTVGRKSPRTPNAEFAMAD